MVSVATRLYACRIYLKKWCCTHFYWNVYPKHEGMTDTYIPSYIVTTGKQFTCSSHTYILIINNILSIFTHLENEYVNVLENKNGVLEISKNWHVKK